MDVEWAAKTTVFSGPRSFLARTFSGNEKNNFVFLVLFSISVIGGLGGGSGSWLIPGSGALGYMRGVFIF